jgi:uncharacterized protein with ParB-like and HNH nuclease domain
MLQGGGLDSLFGSIKKYEKMKIADYQRNYSWGVDEVEELFADLAALINEPDVNHFAGSLIIQQDDNEENPKVCEIVDGQQRLTTFFLLVARIRDIVKDLDTHILPAKNESEFDIDVYALTRNFLYEPSGKKKEFKFESNSLLSKMFVDNMLKEKPRQEPPIKDKTLKSLSKALRDAYRRIDTLFQEKMDEIDSSILTFDESAVATETSQRLATARKLELLYRMMMVIADQVQVLKVTTGKIDESLNVFMTLNARGVPLGPADLVRGQILQNLSSGLDEKATVKLFASMMSDWKEALENLTGAEVDQFLRHLLVSELGQQVTKKQVVKETATYIKRDTLKEQAKATNVFWSDLVRLSGAYRELINPTPNKKYTYFLQVLKPLSASYRILLMNVFDPKHELGEDEKFEIVRQTYILIFRYFAAGLNAQELETTFAGLCKQFRENLDTNWLLKELQTASQIKFDVRDYLQNRVDGSMWAKSILFGIEQNIRTQHGAMPMNLEPATMHLEHVAPQTPTDHWRAALGTENDDEYDDLIESMGNKAVLDPTLNVKAKQDPFLKKASEYYKHASPHLTKNLESLDNWDANLINTRLAWLCEMYELTFPINTPTTKPSQFLEWLKNRQ